MAAAGEKSGEPLGDDGFRESIPLSELDAMTVLDADGQDVPFGDLHKDTKTIVGKRIDTRRDNENEKERICERVIEKEKARETCAAISASKRHEE